MAKKRRAQEDPMNPSPSEEEDGAASDPEAPPRIKKQLKKVASDSSSDHEADSGSGSDSDLPPPPAKTGPDPTTDEAPPAKPGAGEKRLDNNTNDGGGGGGGGGDESKSSKLFQRIWSEDDEIVILQGLADYRSEKGADPFADLNDFYDYIKKSLHVDVSKAQLSAKSRRLRKKFENNVVREKKGKVRSFSNPHEKRAYELSKKVWANASESGNVKSKKKNKNGKSLGDGIGGCNGVSIEQDAEESLSFRISAEGLRLSDKVSAESQSKDGLKELAMQEMELYLRRVELIKFQTKLVLDAIKEANKSG